jgi:hypothetical protein
MNLNLTLTYHNSNTKEGVTLVTNHNNVSIGTISGGIVNFGGAVYISPISITKTNSGSGENNTSPDSEMDTENEPLMKFPKRCNN